MRPGARTVLVRAPDTGRGEVRPRDIAAELRTWGPCAGQLDLLDELAEESPQQR